MQAPIVRRTGTPVQRPQKPPTRLQETLGTPEGQARIRSFVERTEATTPAAFVRSVFFVAGGTVPEGETPLEIAHSLIALRWTPIPGCLSAPRAADLYFLCDAAGVPVRCGFVAKVQQQSAREQTEAAPFFLALDGTTERPYRRECVQEGGRVDFWLRPPGGT